MSTSIELNSNPLSLARGFPTTNIPIDKIKCRDVEHDRIFHEKYKKYLTGKLKLFATRLPLNKITPGFYKPSADGFEYVCDDCSEVNMESIIELIRLGDRPPLHLYHNINKSDQKIFVCPDDVPVFYAYKRLGINFAPVLILGSNKSTIESSLVTRSLKCTYNPYTPHIEGIIGKQHKTVPSLLGNQKPSYEKCFKILINATQEAKSSLKKFHKGGMVKHHYHHTLYSILLRAQETLRAMEILFDENLFLNSASLVRNLYELTLTFYLDWLAPTQTYKFLQLASVTNRKAWEKDCKKTLNEQIKKGLSHNEAQKLFDAKMFGYNIASVVSEKARLFPLGEEHHQGIYSFLSKIIHHDFSMAARYTHTLEHGDETIFNKDAIDTTLYCADIFTTAIITRIIDDIGSSRKLSLETING